MADGEPPAENPETVGPDAGRPAPAEPAPAADQGPIPKRPNAPVWHSPPSAAPSAKSGKAKNTDWQAQWVTWQAHIGNGLIHLGRWVAQLGKGLVHLGRWLAKALVRLSEVRPTPLQTLAILGGLAALSVVGAVTFSGSAIGQACVIAFAPGLCIAIGILGNRWYSKQAPDQHLARATQSAIYTTLHLTKSVRYVDDRLSEAQRHFENGRHDSGVVEVVRAKTATELSLGATEQPSRQWKSTSAGDSDISGLIEGSVARVEDEYTLIVNRGSEHGMRPDMVFAVMADGGDEIVDPETGAVIGELPTEKLRVKVLEVHPKYSRAVSFRTIDPAKADYPALIELAQMTSGPDVPGRTSFGAFDSLDESISKMLETELGESLPVHIGDRIRQVR